MLRPLRPALRDLAGDLLFATGVTRPGRAVARRLSIATFHRVLPVDELSTYPLDEIAVTPDELRWFLAFFAEHFTCGTLAECTRRWSAGERPNRPLLAITFDDGARDNFVHAAPALEEAGLHATFFAVAEGVENGELAWPDRMAYAVRRLAESEGATRTVGSGGATATQRPREAAAAGSEGEPAVAGDGGIDADRAGDGDARDRLTGSASIGDGHERLTGAADVRTLLAELDPDGRLAPKDVARKAVARAKRLWAGDCRAKLARYEELAGGPTRPRWDGVMTWDQLRSLADAGHEIGSHSATHPILTRCDDAELVRETEHSRRLLESRLERTVDSFAYPNGDADERTERAVREAGYVRAVTTRWGPNAPGSPLLRLKRCDMQPMHARSRAGRLSSTRLAWRMSGLHPGLRAP